MMKTTWSENTGTGIPQVDRNHKQLMRILDQIEKHQHDDVRSEAISLIIDQMREFTSCYLRYEEDYMLKMDYPGYQAHKEQHKEFRKKMAALCVDVMNHKETTPREIYRYLSDWVENHLQESDKAMQIFLKARRERTEKT